MPETLVPEIRIGAGLARIEEDRHSPGCYTLVVDGTPQSHVDLGEPRNLSFEYVRRIGHAIDLLPAGPITAVHLGAGALTLPRYVEATRPGSRQQVLELESELVDFVRRELPLPKGASVRVRYGDARETLGKLPAGLRGAADLVVVDVFAGPQTPAHVTSVEFYRDVVELLAPHGIVAVNVADNSQLQFVRSQAATLSAVLPHVAAVADTSMLKGRRFGNVVLLGSATPLPLEALPRVLAGDPWPSKAVAGAELTAWIAGAPVSTDATATPSPLPGRTVFSVKRD
jgi:spermidine synthase